MKSSFTGLALGLLLAMLLVYGLMVILYQSWLDPLIIISAVPGGLGGVVWALALTKSTINTESLMGSIMVVGVATSNSILLVNFANDVRVERGLDATQAALTAAATRLRPVLMTAVAMIVGMIPMALGHGEAGEQNAPLARAVIGGLSAATLMTLFFVPLAYATLRRAPPTKHQLDVRFAHEALGAEGDGT
jgi:multidrug efflux pump subunit AcrB